MPPNSKGILPLVLGYIESQLTRRLTISRKIRKEISLTFLFLIIFAHSKTCIKSFIKLNAPTYVQRNLSSERPCSFLYKRSSSPVLNNSKSSTVNLKDDLEALQLYIEMENFRFNDKFDFAIHVDGISSIPTSNCY